MKRIAIAVGGAATVALLVVTQAAASTAPPWLHVRPGPAHHGHPCVIVGGGNQDTTARVCQDGTAWIS